MKRMTDLKIGDIINISGGEHNHRTGTIARVNKARHWVNIHPMGVHPATKGHVAVKFCSLNSERTIVDNVEVIDTAVFGLVPPVEETEEVHDIAATSESSRSVSDASLTFGNETSSKLLVDLLSQSVVVFEGQDIDEETVNEGIERWQKLLRERMLFYRFPNGIPPGFGY
jgi:hypothetical protein